MDEALARGPNFLAQFEWGCVEGEHTGWATIEAESEYEARDMVPAVARSRARVVRVDRVTPDHINTMLSLPPEAEAPEIIPDPFEAILAGEEESEE
jgi:hypothetical protein